MPPKIHAHSYHICRAWCNDSYTMATKPIKFLELHYTICRLLMKQVSSVKSLGVHIDENLSWTMHIEKIAKKLHRALEQ